ncbi:MAG: hypothetical protein NVSMB56_13900 [Pyrinomonadaceae bacterium]
MKRSFVALGLFFVAFSCALFAQNTPPGNANDAGKEPRVALGEQATAFDTTGNVALGGRLRTTMLNGTPDAPVRNARFVIENRSANAYTFVSGVVTFYDSTGVRCGQGVWNLDALASNEAAELDTPDLRVTCAATTWRVVATSLITRGGNDIAKPNGNTAPAQATPPSSSAPATSPTPAPPQKPPTAQSSTLPTARVARVSTATHIKGENRMFQGLRTVIYHVNDLPKAKAWYANVLNVKPYFDRTFYVGFNVGGFELGLDPDMSNISKGASVIAYWGVSNADAAYEKLIELGATKHEDVRDVGDGIRVGTVIDPFGNLLGVIENSHFKVEDK